MFNERQRKTIFDVLAEKIANLPRNATSFVEQNRDDFQKVARYTTAVDSSHECTCGGRDGVIVSTMTEGQTAGYLALMIFEHDRPNRPTLCHLSGEDSKQLVNRLGEAIAAAEKFNAIKG